MKKQMIAAVGVLALGTSLAIAAPGEGKGHRGKHGAAYGERFAQKLDLTDAQRQQIEQIRKSTRANNAPLFDAMKALHAEKKAAKEANDKARLDALKGRSASLRAQLEQVHAAERAQIMSVLNAEQKAKFEAMKNKKGRGHRGGNKGASRK